MTPLLNVAFVLVSWVAFATTALVVGYAVSRFLLAFQGGATEHRIGLADFWIGVATIIAYLQLWSLFAPVTWVTWIAPLATAPLLLVGKRRSLQSIGEVRATLRAGWLSLLATVIALGFIADRSLGRSSDYDLGLYHLQVIEYSGRFAAVPGLGNLHDRLAASNPHLLLSAFLDVGPWEQLGYRLLNGWLLAALVIDIAWRLHARRRRDAPFTTAVAAIFPLAIVAVFGGGLGYRLASPNLDGAAFVFALVGALYVSEALETDDRFVALLAGAGALSIAGSQRPLFWGWAAFATLIAWRTSTGGRDGRATRVKWRVAVTALPLLIVTGWLARQAVLSGYPLFPLQLGRLDADWAMNSDAVRAYSDTVTRWARWPGHPEAAGGWGWVSHWVHERQSDPDTAAGSRSGDGRRSPRVPAEDPTTINLDRGVGHGRTRVGDAGALVRGGAQSALRTRRDLACRNRCAGLDIPRDGLAWKDSPPRVCGRVRVDHHCRARASVNVRVVAEADAACRPSRYRVTALARCRTLGHFGRAFRYPPAIRRPVLGTPPLHTTSPNGATSTRARTPVRLCPPRPTKVSYLPRYAFRRSSFWSRSAAWPSSTTRPVEST
jgi:hypothetical protein